MKSLKNMYNWKAAEEELKPFTAGKVDVCKAYEKVEMQKKQGRKLQ